MKKQALSLIVAGGAKSPEKAQSEQSNPKPNTDDPPIFTHPQKDVDASKEQRTVKPSNGTLRAPEGIVSLPKMEVQAKRLDILRKALQSNDWFYQWEQKLSVPTELDNVLNGDRFHLPLFGGVTAGVRARKAEFRVHLLELERKLIIAIDVSDSEGDKVSLKELLAEVRSMRRGYEYGETFRPGK